MILLTVAGQTMRMTRFRERTDAVLGEAVRALDNTLLDGTSGAKRAWEGETLPESPAFVATLRAAIAGGPVVCVIRTVSILCRVNVENADVGPDVSGNRADWTNYNDTLSLVLREV
jgi:hypothetical protein